MLEIHDIPPWYWRSLPLERRTGSQIFDCLFRHTGAIATLLESPYPTPPDQPQLARYSICAGMPRIQQGNPQMWTPPVGEILPFLRRLLSSNYEGERGRIFCRLTFHLQVGGSAGWVTTSPGKLSDCLV